MSRRRAMFKIEQGGLPKEYQQVEYIQSSGTQYIDTNYIFLSTESEVYIEFTKLNANSNVNIIGAQAGSPWKLNQTWWFSNSNTINIYNGSASSSISIVYGINIKHKLKVVADNNNLVRVDLDGTTTTKQFAASGSCGIPMFLFCSNSNQRATQFITGNMYSCYFKANDILVRNFVPCYRKSDNVAGMYDLCGSICPLTGTPFYINSGTGSFAVGGNV